MIAGSDDQRHAGSEIGPCHICHMAPELIPVSLLPPRLDQVAGNAEQIRLSVEDDLQIVHQACGLIEQI